MPVEDALFAMNNQRFELSTRIFIFSGSEDDLKQAVNGQNAGRKIRNKRLGKSLRICSIRFIILIEKETLKYFIIEYVIKND